MTLPVPESTLRACVVVPARNEEALIFSCLEALAAQRDIAPGEYEVLLVLDRCTDATEARAREFSRTNPSMRLHLLYGPGRGAGHARRAGMETACERLHALGKGEGLISSTDADTVVAPDWLAAQLRASDRGARAIGGRIELQDADLPEDVAAWRDAQGHVRHLDLLSGLSPSEASDTTNEHWQFSGASLSLTAATYREIGGLEPREALEDEYLERVLRQRGIPIERPVNVRVTTSARLVGRASRGLARDLALATWFRRNSFEHGSFPATNPGSRRRVPSGKVSVVAPLLGDRDDEHVEKNLLAMLGTGLASEVVAVHDGERKLSLPPGIDVHDATVLAPGYGAVRGRGDLMWRALHVVRGDLVVFVDSSVPDPDGTRLAGLIGPLIERDDLEMVKGYSSETPGAESLTELLARPLINLHHPELAGFIDPVSSEFAARRPLLQALPFPVGDGVDVSLLLDAARLAGVNAIAQSDLGPASGTPHGSEPSMRAYALLAAASTRQPDGDSPEDISPGPLFMPSARGLEVWRVAVEERPPLNNREESRLQDMVSG